MPEIYKWCDILTEGLIYLMIVFTPWAFGTTEDWSIWTMNFAAYSLGGILITKWLVRWRTAYRPARWGDSAEETETPVEASSRRRISGGWVTILLASCTCFILLYCLVGALNARAVYLVGQRRFEYFDVISWLPQSYDAASTWQSFFNYLGLAWFFWALRDWLLGKTSSERHTSRDAQDEAEVTRTVGVHRHRTGFLALPERLQRLLWVLCINGGLLALEAILQRLSGTSKLLWLVQPTRNADAESQFGPYAYRSNAAQYLNLVWPVCLGFWVSLRRLALSKRRERARIGEGSHVVLLPLAVIMAACPVISTSRGGAFIAAANMLIAMGVLMWALRADGRRTQLGVVCLFAVVVGLSGYLGWEKLSPRLKTILEDNMSNRKEIYDNALPIVKDYPVFGTGAGTFGSVYQLYRATPSQTWAGYLHDDWLETRATLGWVGFGVVCLMLVATLIRPVVPGGISIGGEFTGLTLASIAGCLLHAKYDFPMQIYSVLFLFLLLSSVLFCVTCRRSAPR